MMGKYLKSRWSLGLLVIGAMILAGCTTAPVQEEPNVPGKPQGQPTAGEPTQPELNESRSRSTAPIVESLLREARQAQARRQWSTAIELAERGLRLDRYQPRLYLVLAESYLQLGKWPASREFARLGLRFLSKSDGQHDDLEAKLRYLANPPNN